MTEDSRKIRSNTDGRDDRGRFGTAAIEGFLKTFEVVNHEERIRALDAAHAREDRNETA